MGSQRKKKRNRDTSPARWFLRQTMIGLVIFLVIGLIIAGIWYGTRMPAFTIDTVVVKPGPTVAADTVRELVEKELQGSYLVLIPKRFVWLYPEEKIKRQIESIAKVDEVKLSVVDNVQLKISFSEHTPYALWCKVDDLSLCLYVTIDGYAFTKAPNLRGGSLYRYVTPETEPAIDSEVAIRQTVVDATWFAERLESVLDFYPYKIILYSDGRVTYERRDGAQILTSPMYAVEETFRYVETLLASEDFQHLPEADFQYIDARFGNKLYVQETLVETASSSASTTSTTSVASTTDTEQ